MIWKKNMMQELWFAFKLVSLNHWKQLLKNNLPIQRVVICFQISIFEPLETALAFYSKAVILLWFAFKLVSLNHWKQLTRRQCHHRIVVICFQISIFEPLETADFPFWSDFQQLIDHFRKRKNSFSIKNLAIPDGILYLEAVLNFFGK